MVQAKSLSSQQCLYRRWIVGTILLGAIVFILLASITIYIDPLFHFHAPLDKYEYIINLQRYQNDGILRNFEYDSIITGTSMTENFMTSEADKLFQAKFIKVPFSGAPYKEIDQNLRRAYEAGKNIRYVIRCLDYSFLVCDKDYWREDVTYPFYSEISPESDVWEDWQKSRRDIVRSMQNHRSRIDKRWSMSKSCASVCVNTAKDEYIRSDVKTERKECADDI